MKKLFSLIELLLIFGIFIKAYIINSDSGFIIGTLFLILYELTEIGYKIKK